MTGDRTPTYVETLRVGWFLTWRLSVIALGLGVAFGFLLGLAGALLGLGNRVVAAVAVAGSLPLTIFGGYPLVVRMMLRKRFAGFRVRLVRETAAEPGAGGEPFGGDGALPAGGDGKSPV